MPRKAARGVCRAAGSGTRKLVQQSVKDEEEMGAEKPTVVNDDKKEDGVVSRATRKRSVVNYAEDDEDEEEKKAVPKKRGRKPKSDVATPPRRIAADHELTACREETEDEATVLASDNEVLRSSRNGGAAVSTKATRNIQNAKTRVEKPASRKRRHSEGLQEDDEELSSDSSGEIVVKRRREPIYNSLLFVNSGTNQASRSFNFSLSDNYYAAYLPLPRMVEVLDWKWNEIIPEEVRQLMLSEMPIAESLDPVKSPNVHERDALGRRTLLWATLHHKDISRNREDRHSGKMRFVQKSVYRQLYQGEKYKFYGDAGHVIARTLGGSDSLDNLFIQNTEEANFQLAHYCFICEKSVYWFMSHFLMHGEVLDQVCDHPGCNYKTHRADILQRHKKKHNK
ncbi:hypothetical protein WR25_05663 [Diploscapter pachys]|uniref:Uncharacterized protein n=1 Tax=Diploscapter pachys TaxID=2018661 RepID=A0A2A2LVK3_9BILA|nr:hypothetical protein WR25_05663 [Diploscapter pachys]